MDLLAKFLNCKLLVYENKTGKVLSVSISAIDQIKFIVDYFNKYPLLGTKSKDYKD
jgi:hypothetical protein